MGFDISGVGEGAVGSGIGAIMGLALGQVNDRRQVRQEERLGRQEMNFSKEMAEFNYQQQMRMWRDTNYSAQMEQLKKAGLNPGLLYGHAGQGGSTGAAQAASPRAGAAPRGGGEGMAMALAGQQSALLAAQTENVKADTAKKNVEATKMGGVDTEEARTRIASLNQGIENAKAQEHLTKAQTYLAQLEGIKQDASMDDQLDQIYYTARMAMKQVELAEQEVYIGSKTLNDKVSIIRAEAIGVGLRNILTKAQTGNTNADTKLKGQQGEKIASDIAVNEQVIWKMAQDVAQNWDSLDIKERELKINTFEADLKAKYPGLLNVTGKALDQFIENIFSLTPRKGWKPASVNK